VRRSLAALSKRIVKAPARPVHTLNLHATLVFLGQIPAERRACIESIADAVQAEPFDVDIDYLDYWFRPRILWCGPRHSPSPLLQLVEDLEAGLEACGHQAEHRPYRMHVTLARKARPLRAQTINPVISWRVDEFVLAASQPVQQPPRYEILKRWTLGRHDAAG